MKNYTFTAMVQWIKESYENTIVQCNPGKAGPSNGASLNHSPSKTVLYNVVHRYCSFVHKLKADILYFVANQYSWSCTFVVLEQWKNWYLPPSKYLIKFNKQGVKISLIAILWSFQNKNLSIDFKVVLIFFTTVLLSCLPFRN